MSKKQDRINAAWETIDARQGTYAPSGAIGSRLYAADLAKSARKGKAKRRAEHRAHASTQGLESLQQKRTPKRIVGSGMHDIERS